MGTICIIVRTSNSGGLVPHPRDLRPWSQRSFLDSLNRAAHCLPALHSFFVIRRFGGPIEQSVGSVCVCVCVDDNFETN